MRAMRALISGLGETGRQPNWGCSSATWLKIANMPVVSGAWGTKSSSFTEPQRIEVNHSRSTRFLNNWTSYGLSFRGRSCLRWVNVRNMTVSVASLFKAQVAALSGGLGDDIPLEIAVALP